MRKLRRNWPALSMSKIMWTMTKCNLHRTVQIQVSRLQFVNCDSLCFSSNVQFEGLGTRLNYLEGAFIGPLKWSPVPVGRVEKLGTVISGKLWATCQSFLGWEIVLRWGARALASHSGDESMFWRPQQVSPSGPLGANWPAGNRHPIGVGHLSNDEVPPVLFQCERQWDST